MNATIKAFLQGQIHIEEKEEALAEYYEYVKNGSQKSDELADKIMEDWIKHHFDPKVDQDVYRLMTKEGLETPFYTFATNVCEAWKNIVDDYNIANGKPEDGYWVCNISQCVR